MWNCKSCYAMSLYFITDLWLLQINLLIYGVHILTLFSTIWSKIKSTRITLWSPAPNFWGRIDTAVGITLSVVYTLSIGTLSVTCGAGPGKLNFLKYTSIIPILFSSFASFPVTACLLISAAKIILLSPSSRLVMKLTISVIKCYHRHLDILYCLRYLSLCIKTVSTVDLDLIYWYAVIIYIDEMGYNIT